MSPHQCGLINTLLQSSESDQTHHFFDRDLQKSDTSVQAEPASPPKQFHRLFLLAHHFGTHDQYALEVAKTTSIVADCQMQDAPKPYQENVEIHGFKGQRVLGGEFDTGKMPLNLYGLATGLFSKDKNLCLFSHWILNRNSETLGSYRLSLIKPKRPVGFPWTFLPPASSLAGAGDLGRHLKTCKGAGHSGCKWLTYFPLPGLPPGPQPHPSEMLTLWSLAQCPSISV